MIVIVSNLIVPYCYVPPWCMKCQEALAVMSLLRCVCLLQRCVELMALLTKLHVILNLNLMYVLTTEVSDNSYSYIATCMYVYVCLSVYVCMCM